MMPRTVVRTSLLEWGQSTDSPRSQVFDSDGGHVFTTSRVCSLADNLLTGVVEELVSVEEIVVRWVNESLGLQHVSPREVIVVEALPTTS